MLIVCAVGFALASGILCTALLAFYWVLSRPFVWLFGW